MLHVGCVTMQAFNCLVSLEGLNCENSHLRELVSSKCGCGHVLYVLQALDVRPSNNEDFLNTGLFYSLLYFFISKLFSLYSRFILDARREFQLMFFLHLTVKITYL